MNIRYRSRYRPLLSFYRNPWLIINRRQCYRIKYRDYLWYCYRVLIYGFLRRRDGRTPRRLTGIPDRAGHLNLNATHTRRASSEETLALAGATRVYCWLCPRCIYLQQHHIIVFFLSFNIRDAVPIRSHCHDPDESDKKVVMEGVKVRSGLLYHYILIQ